MVVGVRSLVAERAGFKNLDVWKRSHELTLTVYKLTATFPASEMFGLAGQTKRAASSIPANIAEGCGRDSSADFARFLQIAQGSASELEYHLLFARDLGFVNPQGYEEAQSKLTRIRKMLTCLIQWVPSGSKASQTHRSPAAMNQLLKTNNQQLSDPLN